MNTPTVIEYKDIRVLTTEQLAQVYETDINNIKNNFNNNKDRFVEGTHYYFLQGEDLKEFNLQVNDIDLQISPMTRHLYLWTERGASRHCKILDTGKAWEQFDYLEDTYFRVKEQLKTPLTYKDALKELIIQLEETEKLEAENKQLEVAKERLEVELDYSKQWYSIKRVAKINRVDWKTFDWRPLKKMSFQLGYEIRKIFDANYEEVNTYHYRVWRAVYPQYKI